MSYFHFFKFFFKITFLISTGLIFAEESLLDDQKSMGRAFHLYEKEISKSSENNKPLEEISKLNERFSKESETLQNLKKQNLITMEKNYENILDSSKSFENSQLIRVHLAFVRYLIALGDSDRDIKSEFLKKALVTLEPVDELFVNLNEKQMAYYLLAQIYSIEKRSDLALKTWLQLAKIKKESIYTLHANLALGDYYFERAKALEALQYYERGKKILTAQVSETISQESIRVEYRILWASYKAGKLEESITAAKTLLTSLFVFKNYIEAQGVIKDSIEILGDSLLESKKVEQVISWFENPVTFVDDEVAFYMIRRYKVMNLFGDADNLANFFVNHYPKSIHYISELNYLAKRFLEKNNKALEISTLEKMAYTLPQNSLWSEKNKDNLKEYKEAQKLAIVASTKVASHYQGQGLKTKDPQDFVNAIRFYDLASEHSEGNDEWFRLKFETAKCMSASKNLEQAIMSFKYLIDKIPKTNPLFEKSYVQTILNLNKKWQEFYIQASNLGKKANEDTNAKEILLDQEKILLQYLELFENKEESFEYVLQTANAYNTMLNREKAIELFQIILTKKDKSTKQQQSEAILGIVMSKVASGNRHEIIESIDYYLNTFKVKNISDSLYKELLRYQLQTINTYVSELTAKGEYKTAGDIQASQSKNFEGFNERYRLLRDGAYNLALANDWNYTKEIIDIFKKEKIEPFKDEMIYLQAKYFEYGLDFKKSYQEFLSFAQKYPSHEKASSALEKVVEYAFYENDFKTSAKALTILTKKSKNIEQTKKYLEQAAMYYKESNVLKEMRLAFKHRIDLSKKQLETLGLEFQLAQYLYDLNQTKEAISLSQNIYQKILKSPKDNLDEYKELENNIGFFIADDLLKKIKLIKNVEIEKKLTEFSKLKNYYEKIIQNQETASIVKSQFLLAQSYDELSQELGIFLKDHKNEKYNSLAANFHEKSQSLLSKNALLFSNKELNPKDEWLQKSFLRLKSTSIKMPYISHNELNAKVMDLYPPSFGAF